MTCPKMSSPKITFDKSILLLISLTMIAALVACNSSSPSNSTTRPPTPSVSLSTVPTPTPTTLAVNGTLSITATILNDSGNVNWSCTPGNTAATCGSFSASSSATGVAVTYTAPATVPTASVVITATLADNASISASTGAIAITAASGITVAITTPSPYLAVSAFTGITPTTNDSAGVNWTVTCGSAACGSFNPIGTLTGVSTTYQAPSAIPTGTSVTVTATSVTDSTKSASANIFITNIAALAPSSTYVFSLSGQNINGFYSVSGAFTVGSNGAITGGEQDFIDVDSNTTLAAPFTDTIQASGSSLTPFPDGNLQIVLNTGDTNIGVSGIETLQATMVSSSKALVIEFDTSATSSGTLDLQTSTVSPLGGYAFFVAGEDPAGPSTTAIGGVINVDSPGGISGGGSVFDFNDFSFPTFYTDQLFGSSSVSLTPDTFGRVQFTLNAANSDTVNPGQINLIGYVIDASHIELVETADGYGGVTSGTALGQTGTFLNSSVSGSSYVFGTNGADTTNGILQVAGVFTLTATPGSTTAGTVSGTLNFNDLTAQSPQGGSAFTGTYTIDPTGRVTLSNLADGATFSYDLQAYLTGDGHATVISVDTNDVVAGLGFQQTGGGSFTAASFSGSYALNVVQLTSNGLELDGVGAFTADGVGTLGGFVDLNIASEGLIPSPDLSLSGTFTSNASGVFVGTLTGIDSVTTGNADNFTYYLVDTTRAVAIETDTDQLTLGYFELQQ